MTLKSEKQLKKFTFIDLFAGIGGFHQALKSLGGECVTASEIDQKCVELYKENFSDTKVVGDINNHYKKLPKFDVLVGGFPCQPFSKAGNQKGFEEERGKLFYTIVEILKQYKDCKFFLLENVKNLARKKENWDKIVEELRKLDYYVTENPIILSPKDFGIPQTRERVYILGIRKDIKDNKKLENDFITYDDIKSNNWWEEKKNVLGDAKKIIEKDFPDFCKISDKQQKILDFWLEFKKGTNFEKPQTPIWIDYFGYKLSDFDYENEKFKNLSRTEDGKNIWVYKKISEMPLWKQNYARKNRFFYLKHKQFIDKWLEETKMLDEINVYKKFEWNLDSSKNVNDSYENTIIQFRQSGIRVKKNDFFPALVALANIPIIYDHHNKILRRISPKEAAKLQSFKDDYKIPTKNNAIYKQLGNAVNVQIIEKLLEKLLSFAISDWKDKR